MQIKRKTTAALVPTLSLVAALGTTTTLANATGNVATPSATERVNFSGKTRMLSQRMAAAACNLSAGIAVDESRKVLTNGQVEFKKIAKGLRNGDKDLNIEGAEKSGAVLAALDAMAATWQPIDAAITALAKDPTATAEIATINDQNLALLGDAKSLVKEIVGAYTNATDKGQIDKLIDIAGRQRMLTQKMSKEACQIWSGDHSDEMVASLQATMKLFEDSLINLRDGNNDEGIAAAPSADIKAALEKVAAQWGTIKPELEKAVAKEAVDQDFRVETFNHLNGALVSTNAVVGAYTSQQKLQGNLEDLGATERVNFSGKLRMLSQRVSAAACNYHAGNNQEASLEILIAAQTEFLKISNALEFGDPDLRIKGQEERRKTLHALKKLHEQWVPINAAIDNLVQGKDAEAALNVILDQNMALLSEAKLLVSEVSGQYSDPTAMLQADAMLVDISGRQRMLTQKMAKESCSVWSGHNVAAQAEALTGTMQMFEVSLMALRDGMLNAGIKPAPTAEIKAGLDDIWSDWNVLKPTLEKAAAQETVDDTVEADTFAQLSVMLKEMNAVVGLYTEFAKTGL